MILVSACLAGVNCRYDGTNRLDPEIARMVRDGEAIGVCPEQCGGMRVPHPPIEIRSGTGADVLDGRSLIFDVNGTDMTRMVLNGSYKVLDIAKRIGATKAILKAKSPSCASGHIYDGSFTGTLREGNGVTAELLKRNSIKVEDR